MNIYVGNLSYEVNDRDLETVFSAFGTVTSARVIKEMDSGRSKGFGFVEMESKDSAETAIAELNGTELKGRTITVNEARPKTECGSRGGGGGGGRGGYGGGGGGGNRGGGGGRGGYGGGGGGGGGNRGGDRW